MVLAVLGLGTGCDPAPESRPVVYARAPLVATSEPGASRSAELPDPIVLAELIDHVPSARPRQPTGPDGGTLIGTDSGEEGEELPETPPAASHKPLTLGRPRFQPLLSNPAIERAARAQIYWRLRTCTTAAGDLPPPESITLSFTLRPDATVDPATVDARAQDQSLDAVVECVVREFSAISFRGPTAARGLSPRVVITWPSVD